jgi:prephenate dehydrogenase
MMPDPKCPSEAIDLAEDIIRIIGGQPRFMDAAEHDGLISASEELPMLAGSALFYTLTHSEGWMELRRMINPTLALMFQSLRYQTPQDLLSLYSQNRANMARNIEALMDTLSQVQQALESEDDEALETFISQVQKAWDKWDVKRHSGQWDEVKGVEFSTGGPLGSMTGFFSIGRLHDKSPKDEDDEE